MRRAFLLVSLSCRSEQRFDRASAHPDPSLLETVDAGTVVPPAVVSPGADVLGAEIPEVTPPTPPQPCLLQPDAALVAACRPGVEALLGAEAYSALQDAIDDAPVGGTVVVCPGWWPGAYSLYGGRQLVAADPTPGATTLVGALADGPVLFTSDAALTGLGIVGGNSSGGGGGIYGMGDLSLECVAVEGNTSDQGSGAGIYVEGRLTARHSTFSDNRAAGSGGAIAAGALDLEDVTFTDNAAGDGGGAVVWGATTLERATFTGNRATRGGALSIASWAGASSTFTDIVFDGNTADVGGTVYASSYAPARLSFERATVTNGRGSTGAGGIELASASPTELTLTDVAFTNNDGGEAGALAVTGWLSLARVHLSLVHFLDNTGDVAAAFSVSPLAGDVRIDATNLRVWRNEAPMGAASLEADDSFRCDPCDFGAGADDNVPTDATIGGASEPAIGAAWVQ